LIPVNPTSHAPDFRRPSDAALDAFVAAVKEVEPRVHVALRVQRGDDEAAACGQLLINRKELKAAQEEAAKVTV